MTASTSQAVQHRTVGQGLALGALIRDVNEVNGNPMTLELDFRRAWRRWDHGHRFPRVHVGPARDDILRILHAAPGRRGVATWEGEWPFVPALRVDEWTADKVAEIIDPDVPADAWADLVAAWIPDRVHPSDTGPRLT